MIREPVVSRFTDAPFDQPVPGLDRWKQEGEQMLTVKVVLHPGCVVPLHRHESEQISVILSGRVKWILGEDQREEIVEGGTFVLLPSNCLHGVVALEETHIVDILSPKGPMGVDAAKP